MPLSPRILTIKLIILTLLTLSSMALAAPIGDPGKKRPPASDSVATVNGKDISEWTLKRYTQQRGLPPEAATGIQRQTLIEELINRELIYQNAISLGVDKTPAVQAEIEHQRVNIIAGVMLNPASDRFAVDEEAMRKEYESRLDELSGTEYRARHILVASEREAQEIIDELNEDGDFAELANEYSTGPSSEKGGDLGWFRAEQMMPQFAEAVRKMKVGTYTQSPVKTDFGWHVIALEEVRDVPPPAFDSIKEQIRVGLQGRLMQNYIADLRKAANIQKH